MKRIGYLSGAPRVSTRPEAEESGPRAHVLGVIGGFEKLGWEVKTFIVGDRYPKQLSTKGSGKMVSRGWSTRLVADLTRLGFAFLNSRLVLREIGEVDLVYERFGLFQALGRRFKRRSIPWILEVNSMMSHEAVTARGSSVLFRLSRRSEYNALHECDMIVCVSEPLKDLMVTAAEIPASKIIVLPTAVDVDFYDPAGQGPNRHFEGFTIGFSGRLYPWQGVDHLIQAVGRIRDEDGISLNLTIVGDGMTRPALEKLAQDLGLSSTVRFVGQVPASESAGYIAGFDVGYCSRSLAGTESMYFSPIKLFEYMSMARPVVCARYAEFLEVIQEGKTGFTFQAGDDPSLKDALLRAYEARPNLQSMGERARRNVISHHTWQARVKTVVEESSARLGHRLMDEAGSREGESPSDGQ